MNVEEADHSFSPLSAALIQFISALQMDLSGNYIASLSLAGNACELFQGIFKHENLAHYSVISYYELVKTYTLEDLLQIGHSEDCAKNIIEAEKIGKIYNKAYQSIKHSNEDYGLRHYSDKQNRSYLEQFVVSYDWVKKACFGIGNKSYDKIFNAITLPSEFKKFYIHPEKPYNLNEAENNRIWNLCCDELNWLYEEAAN
jgi:hypothetical protein